MLQQTASLSHDKLRNLLHSLKEDGEINLSQEPTAILSFLYVSATFISAQTRSKENDRHIVGQTQAL